MDGQISPELTRRMFLECFFVANATRPHRRMRSMQGPRSEMALNASSHATRTVDAVFLRQDTKDDKMQM